MGKGADEAGRESNQVSSPNMALTWAGGAVVLLIMGLTLDIGWTIYLAAAVWAGVALVWWIRYRRSRAEQRD